MASSVFCMSLLSFLLFAAKAEDRVRFTDADELRWNTPPELIPEQIVRNSDTKMEQSRLLSAPISGGVNGDTVNIAHSVGFQVGLGGLSFSQSYAQSNTRLSNANGGSISGSQSLSFAGGSPGITGSTGHAITQNNPIHSTQANQNSQSFNLGHVTTSSSASAQNTHINTGRESSPGNSHSTGSASTGSLEVSLAGEAKDKYQFQGQLRPVWTNIRPDHDYPHSRLPTLVIDAKPYEEHNRGTIRLHVSSHDTNWERNKPKIHVHKWHPGHAPGCCQGA